MLYQINGGDSRVVINEETGTATLPDPQDGDWTIYPVEEDGETYWLAENTGGDQGFIWSDQAWAAARQHVPQPFESREAALGHIIGLPEWSAYAAPDPTLNDDFRVKVAGPAGFVISANDDDIPSDVYVMFTEDDDLWSAYTHFVDRPAGGDGLPGHDPEIISSARGYEHPDQVIHLFLGDPHHTENRFATAS